MKDSKHQRKEETIKKLEERGYKKTYSDVVEETTRMEDGEGKVLWVYPDGTTFREVE